MALALNISSPLHSIGAGACGSVWSTAATNDDSQAVAFKREDGNVGRSLLNDFEKHKRLASNVVNCPPEVRSFLLPHYHGFLGANSVNEDLLCRFPDGFRKPCNTLTMERIPPLGRPVRDFIAEMFCPPSMVQTVKQDIRSRDCLVRPYLGRRRHAPSILKSFTLRNYILTVDQMEVLGLYKDTYAKAMAEALAFMHWSAQIDADDVEFILAPPRESTDARCFCSDSLGCHSLWILDFDRCRAMPMNEEGILLATAAFYRNDLYFPRPGREHIEDQRLWQVFKARFLEASTVIINSGETNIDQSLPAKLVAQIEVHHPQRGGKIEPSLT
ncbi:hypothetical protein JX266_002335 [Neoarthrinium moseri]|nr:hypothetical protein JX266_002335 [Neoarthrinium moseri]